MRKDELREKVIKGFTRCDGAAIQLGHCPEDCPYLAESERADQCLAKLHADAMELLKAQEPHVMTITEALDAEVAWLEQYADPADGVEPIIRPVIIRYYENGYWQCLVEQDESADLSLFLDGFGTEFRFWTSRPTDEQRSGTPWR